MKANFEKGTKVCSRCRCELPLEHFQVSNYRGDGLHIYCRKCNLEIQHKYIERNYEKVQKKRKDYRHSERGREVRRMADNKRTRTGVAAQYIRDKKKRMPHIKTIINLRTRIGQIIKREYKTIHTIELIGCSSDELKTHLEMQFEPGMTWENYGTEWHVDHIVPCSYFDLTDPEQQRICFNYRNLQPLWAKDNLEKSNSVSDNVEELVEFLKQEIYVNN